MSSKQPSAKDCFSLKATKTTKNKGKQASQDQPSAQDMCGQKSQGNSKPTFQETKTTKNKGKQASRNQRSAEDMYGQK
ncbi:hypothetical protein TIFTF001_007288 [Ficus carica]|uniref:Uncharacterized protein n=1 Tax=Ficus carica TaxID=3494 RepID=A0AA88A668_FICCA|nr:hypothetical protein TIFTF001_007288 [Ficus carica]